MCAEVSDLGVCRGWLPLSGLSCNMLCPTMLCKDAWASYGITGSSNHITIQLMCDKWSALGQNRVTESFEQVSSIWGALSGGRDEIWLVAGWALPGCCSCWLATLQVLLVSAARRTHTRDWDRIQQEESRRHWDGQESWAAHGSLQPGFFFLFLYTQLLKLSQLQR